MSITPTEWMPSDQTPHTVIGSGTFECRFAREGAPAHALGALEPDDAARLDRHCAICPGCAQLLAEFRETIVLLPFASPQHNPSASVKLALFSRIEELSLTPAPAASMPSFPVDAAGRTITIPSSRPSFSAPAKSQSAAGDSGSRRFRPTWEQLSAPLAAVPLVLALAIVGGWAVRSQDQLSDRSTEVTALRSQNVQLSQQIQEFAATIPGTSSQKIELAHVDAPEKTSTSYLLANPNSKLMTIVLNHVTEADNYQVTAECVDGKVLQLGQVNVNEAGDGTTSWPMDTPPSQFRSVHVRPLSNAAASSDSYPVPDVLRADMTENLGADDGTTASSDPH